MYRLNATSDSSSLSGKVLRRRSSDMVSSLGASSSSGSSSGGGIGSRRRYDSRPIQSGMSGGGSYDSPLARRRGRKTESSTTPSSTRKRPSSISSQEVPKHSNRSIEKLEKKKGSVSRSGSTELIRSRKETESTSSMSSFLAMDCQDENDHAEENDRLMDSGLFTRPTDNRASNKTPTTLSIWESTKPRKAKTSPSIHTAATKRTESSEENNSSPSEVRRTGGAAASSSSIGKASSSPTKGREQMMGNARAGSSFTNERKELAGQTEGNNNVPMGGPGGIVITVPEGEEMKDLELDLPDFGGQGHVIFATKRAEDDDEISQLSTSIFGNSTDQWAANSSSVPSGQEAVGPSNFRMSGHSHPIGNSSYNERNPMSRPQHVFTPSTTQTQMAATPFMRTNMSQWPQTQGLPAYDTTAQMVPSYLTAPTISPGVWVGQQPIPHPHANQLVQQHQVHSAPYLQPHHNEVEQDFEPLLLPTRTTTASSTPGTYLPAPQPHPLGSTIPDEHDASLTRRTEKCGPGSHSAHHASEMQAPVRRHSLHRGESRRAQHYANSSALSVCSMSSFHDETIPPTNMDSSDVPSTPFPHPSVDFDPYNDSLYRPSGRMTGKPPSSPLMSFALRLRLVILSLLNDFGMRERSRHQKMYDSEDETSTVPPSGICGSFGSRSIPDMDYHRMTMGMPKGDDAQGNAQGGEVVFRILWKLLFGLCVVTVCLLGLQTALGDGNHLGHHQSHHQNTEHASHRHALKRVVVEQPRVPLTTSVGHQMDSPTMAMQYQPQTSGGGVMGGMTRKGWVVQDTNPANGVPERARERSPAEVVKASPGIKGSTESAMIQGNKETVVVLPETLENLVDIWDLPVDRSYDVPFFWHIPRSAGATMNSILSEVYHLTLASDAGGKDARAQETELQIVKFALNNHYVNVDTSTEEGLQRAKSLNLIPSGLAHGVVSTLLHQSATLFTPSRRGRMFALVRHPVERAVSLFYHLKDSVGRASSVDMTELSIEEYYQRGLGERNWMTRFLADQPTKTLDEIDLAIAKEVLRRKCLVGLMESLDESLARFEHYFGWSIQSESDREKLEKLLHWTWPMRHKHSIVIENSATWALIVRYNEFDLQLYHYARTLFQEQAMMFSRDMP